MMSEGPAVRVCYPRRLFHPIFFVMAQNCRQLRQKTFAALSDNSVQR
ncbi:hypothetical protein LPU83_3571 [Rhizobium favelukesii]|uniref:Uncharacterized protein n=1 Tax=Rhizobium favelukesii TaxID=348824 RepID=W6REC6_9HYPH|nr:hypothetical protein LPU83_3571 [Rhizobium favelukesii]